MKMPKPGLVLQGYFPSERFLGTVNRSALVQPKNPARSTPQPPRPDLLPAKMRIGTAQAKAEHDDGRAWSGAPRPELLPGMGPTRVGGLWRVAQARSGTEVSTTPIPAGQLRVIGNGRPLEPAIRQTMEHFFQSDLSGVRIHEGPAAPSIGALAFTLGEAIHFAPGLYDPTSRRGIELLGHELAHVVQQRDGRVANPYGQGVAIVQDPTLEAESERTGWRLADELWSPRVLGPAKKARDAAKEKRYAHDWHPPNNRFDLVDLSVQLPWWHTGFISQMKPGSRIDGFHSIKRVPQIVQQMEDQNGTQDASQISTQINDLPHELIDHIGRYLDNDTLSLLSQAHGPIRPISKSLLRSRAEIWLRSGGDLATRFKLNRTNHLQVLAYFKDKLTPRDYKTLNNEITTEKGKYTHMDKGRGNLRQGSFGRH